MKLIREESELEHARLLLLQMEKDPSLITSSAYRANAETWPNHQIPFVDAHIAYLKAYPQVRLQDYISNLRLQLKNTIQKQN